MTGIEAYNKIDNTLCLNSQNLKFNIDTEEHIDCKNTEEMVKCLETISKQLEALEIIKKKRVDVNYLKLCFVDNSPYFENGLEEYNTFREDEEEQLTQEEFELLKELLKND